MNNVIYVDILLMINLLVNFLMLSAAGLLVKLAYAHFRVRRRCLLAYNISTRYESVFLDSSARRLLFGNAVYRVSDTLTAGAFESGRRISYGKLCFCGNNARRMAGVQARRTYI